MEPAWCPADRQDNHATSPGGQQHGLERAAKTSPRNSLSKLTPRDGEKLLGTSPELQPSLWAAEWGSRTPCSGLGWLGVGVWGSRASTFSGVSGLAPAHRQALCYVLVIRLQVQLPLHLQGMGLIRWMATATAPHSAHDKSAAVIDPQGIPPSARGTAPRGMEAPAPDRNGLTGAAPRLPRMPAGMGGWPSRGGPHHAAGSTPKGGGEGKARPNSRARGFWSGSWGRQVCCVARYGAARPV